MLQVQHFFDSPTSTLAYVIFDTYTKDAVVIDPAAYFDITRAHLEPGITQDIIHFIQVGKLNPIYSIETHIHADHLTGFSFLKHAFKNIKSVIHGSIVQVQQTFQSLSHSKDIPKDGPPFDIYMRDQDTLNAGLITIKTIHTPGHTPSCTSLLVQDMLFCGDALFMPDFGTGRCDFPGGSAKELYHTITTKLYPLPDATRVFVGHDYQPGGRDLKWETTILEEKKNNKHLNENTTQKDFIDFRTQRDKELGVPKLMEVSLPFNLNAGLLNTDTVKIVAALRNN